MEWQRERALGDAFGHRELAAGEAEAVRGLKTASGELKGR